MITARRYSIKDKTVWNRFVAGAKNGLFLFDRNYMDYHSDRYPDHSLLFFENQTLLALLPANEKNGVLYSHGGLTFGGIICDTRMTTSRMLDVFGVLLAYAKAHRIRSIVYKAIPPIYHQIPAQEDLYALYRNGAVLVGRDIASVVDFTRPLPYHLNTKRLFNTAKRLHLTVAESWDYNAYMHIVSSLLSTKYHTKPTHTAQELSKLAEKFPKNIRLFTANVKSALLGGVIVYDYPTVAHCQYIAASDRGKQLGVLNPLFQKLLTHDFINKRYFSFGKSTERLGGYLNTGLIQNKEHYGGRGIVHDTYKLSVL